MRWWRSIAASSAASWSGQAASIGSAAGLVLVLGVLIAGI